MGARASNNRLVAELYLSCSTLVFQNPMQDDIYATHSLFLSHPSIRKPYTPSKEPAVSSSVDGRDPQNNAAVILRHNRRNNVRGDAQPNPFPVLLSAIP